MKSKKIIIAIASVVVVLLLGVGAVGMMASNAPSLQKVDGNMRFVNADSEKTQLQTGDLICFGTKDDSLSYDTLWRVLDAKNTNTGEPGMYLMTENLVAPQGEIGILFNDVEEPTGNDYRGTTIHEFCTEFPVNHFSDVENQAVIETYKSDAEYHTPTVFNGRNVFVDFDPAEDILQGDKVFLLSAEEVNNEKYGFTDNESRIATYKGTAANWWLRSPHDDDFPLDVGFVFANGWQADLYVNGFSMLHTEYTARLAMNMDTSALLFMTKTDVKEQVSAWTCTLLDEKYSDFEAKKIVGTTDTFLVNFSGAGSGKNEHVSAFIVNNSGEITYYGNIENSKESGVCLINLSGKYHDGDALYLFAESENENGSSGSASKLVRID